MVVKPGRPRGLGAVGDGGMVASAPRALIAGRVLRFSRWHALGAAEVGFSNRPSLVPRARLVVTFRPVESSFSKNGRALDSP